MQINAYIVNAFTANSAGGNGAGVVLDAENLSDQQMLDITKELGFSETAFVSVSKVATYKVRFFTSTEEVNLCGHATIATWSLLHQRGLAKAGNHMQETLAGILGIDIQHDGSVFMQQTEPLFLETAQASEAAVVLGIEEVCIDSKLPVQVVSTGLRDLFVPIRTKKDLLRIKPDLPAMITLSKKYNVTGLHVFALNKGQITAFARNFSPRVGIDEESATGTSNGALLCYLKNYGKLLQTQSYCIEQGESMGNLSYILGKFVDGRVWVGGQATILSQRSITA